MTQRILRVTYQRARQADLANFSNNVIRRMTEDPAYASLKPEVDLLTQRYNTYLTAIADSLGFGTAKVLAKNLAKAELVRQLNTVADVVEQLAQGDPQVLINAGFGLYNTASNSRFQGMPRPIIAKARSTGELGEIAVVIDGTENARIQTYAVEYSADQGQTWVNGFYHNHRSFRVGNLPPMRDLMIRVQAIGLRGTKSVWSEAFRVAVA